MKSQYWQTVRGVCILAVIAIHCPRVYDGINLFPYLIIRDTINFPVAIFIFIAGYFINTDKVSFLWLKNRGGGS